MIFHENKIRYIIEFAMWEKNYFYFTCKVKTTVLAKTNARKQKF